MAFSADVHAQKAMLEDVFKIARIDSFPGLSEYSGEVHNAELR